MSDAPRFAGSIFVDGAFVPAARAQVSALDRGLLYGDGLFETFRTYRGIPFALDDHLSRLRQAAERIRLPVRRSSSWWRTVIAEVLRRNRLDSRDAVVRVTITRGAGGAGLIPPRGIRPTILVVARALPRQVSSWQQSGVPVVLLPFHPGLDGLLGGLKTTDYLTALMGKMLAREHGAFEGIYQTASGEVLEGTTSNVFLANGRRLETPPVSRGILPGITRERVLSIARRNGFAVRERTIRTRELRDAQAAFLTASTIEVMPIRSVDGHPLRGDRSSVAALHQLFRTDRDTELFRERQESAYKN